MAITVFKSVLAYELSKTLSKKHGSPPKGPVYHTYSIVHMAREREAMNQVVPVPQKSIIPHSASFLG